MRALYLRVAMVVVALAVVAVTKVSTRTAQCEFEGENYDEGFCIDDSSGCGFWLQSRICLSDGTWSDCYLTCEDAREANGGGNGGGAGHGALKPRP